MNRTAKILCMASAKGGSGKTVLTAAFGTFLAAVGKKVLIIDTDAATNGLTLMFLKEVQEQAKQAREEERQPFGVFEIESDLSSPEITKLKTGIDLIPATYGFINTEAISLSDFKLSLRRILDLSGDSYDYIFLDAQAGADAYAQTAMSRSVSHEVIIVSEYDPMSAAGIERLKGLLPEDLAYERNWILLNKMLPEFVESFPNFLEVSKYLSPMPWDADVVRAYANRTLALDLESGNEYTLAILQSVKSLLKEEVAEELTTWINQRTASIREPIEEQYKDAEKDLSALFITRHNLVKARNRRTVLRLFLVGMIAIVFAISILLLVLSLTNTLISFSYWYVLLSSSLISVGFYLSRLLFKQSSQLDIDIEEARIQRREELLKERLRKLEFLRIANIESLVRLDKRPESLEEIAYRDRKAVDQSKLGRVTPTWLIGVLSLTILIAFAVILTNKYVPKPIQNNNSRSDPELNKPIIVTILREDTSAIYGGSIIIKLTNVRYDVNLKQYRVSAAISSPNHNEMVIADQVVTDQITYFYSGEREVKIKIISANTSSADFLIEARLPE